MLSFDVETYRSAEAEHVVYVEASRLRLLTVRDGFLVLEDKPDELVVLVH